MLAWRAPSSRRCGGAPPCSQAASASSLLKAVDAHLAAGVRPVMRHPDSISGSAPTAGATIASAGESAMARDASAPARSVPTHTLRPYERSLRAARPNVKVAVRACPSAVSPSQRSQPPDPVSPSALMMPSSRACRAAWRVGRRALTRAAGAPKLSVCGAGSSIRAPLGPSSRHRRRRAPSCAWRPCSSPVAGSSTRCRSQSTITLEIRGRGSASWSALGLSRRAPA